MSVRPALFLLSFCAGLALAQAPQNTPAREDSKPAAQPPAKSAQPPAKAEPVPERTVTAETATSPLDFTAQDIDGKDAPLSRYKGQVLLIVNVASKCGYTPQYEQLQALFAKHKDRGLRIAAFPANNFRGQEPGTNGEIKAFCHDTYNVGFDLFAKISVKGQDQAELYKWLTSKEKNPAHGGEIQWNFTKFLIGRDGKVIARFEPKVRPDDPAVVKAVEDALAAQPTPAEPAKPPDTKKPKDAG